MHRTDKMRDVAEEARMEEAPVVEQVQKSRPTSTPSDNHRTAVHARPYQDPMTDGS